MRSSSVFENSFRIEEKLTDSLTIALCSVIIRSVSASRRSNSAFRFSAYRRTTSPMNSATGRYRNRCSMSLQ